MASEKPPTQGISSTLSPEANNLSDSNGSFGTEEKHEAQNHVDVEKRSNENVMACLQVIGGFFLMFNTWGVANTFGAFQTYYEGGLLQNDTPSKISWIGSLQAFFLLFIGGLCTGQIYDAGYLRGLVTTGSVSCVFGMMMLSICKQYWEVVLAQGLVVGFGTGCLLLPSIAVFPQYFTKRRAFATGLAVAGSSIGGLIYSTVFHKLQPRIGFPWAVRAMAFIMLATLAVPVAVMRAKYFPSSRRPFIDLKALREVPYVLFTIGEVFGFMGMYIPFYYISTYSISKGIVDENLGFYLLGIINASSVVGRVVPGFFADIIGPLNMMIPFSLLCGVVAFCWTTASSIGAVIVLCLFYGFFSGTFISVIGPALATLCPDLSLMGTHMGMSFACGAIGLLIGNPVAGVLLDRASWIGPATFCGAANILAAAFMLWARIYKTGWKLVIKA